MVMGWLVVVGFVGVVVRVNPIDNNNVPTIANAESFALLCLLMNVVNVFDE